MEKYIKNGLTALVIAWIGWMGINVSKIPAIEEKVNNLCMKQAITRDEFSMMIEPLVTKVVRNQKDIEAIQNRVHLLETDLYVKYPNPHKRVE